jgi:hypothetical protein
MNFPQLKAYTHFMRLETDEVQPVLDDSYTLVRAHIDNGVWNSHEENRVTLRVNDSSAEVAALAWGGLVVFANIDRDKLYRALLLGLSMLWQHGQLSEKDFLDHEQPPDATPSD